jgi:hypothetical protein
MEELQDVNILLFKKAKAFDLSDKQQQRSWNWCLKYSVPDIS